MIVSIPISNRQKRLEQRILRQFGRNMGHSDYRYAPGAAMHQKEKDLRRRPRSSWAGGWRRLPKRFGGGYCRLQMPLRLALGVRGTVGGRKLGASEGGGGPPPPLQCISARGGLCVCWGGGDCVCACHDHHRGLHCRR